MKKYILLIFLTAFSAAAQSQQSTDKEELIQMLHEFMDGASRNDREVHDNFWAEDLIYTSSAGTRFGKKEIMSGFDDSETSSGQPPTTVYTAEDIIVQQYDDVAVVAFKMRGTTGSETHFYLNSGTFVKRNGEWEVVNWQATKIP